MTVGIYRNVTKKDSDVYSAKIHDAFKRHVGDKNIRVIDTDTSEEDYVIANSDLLISIGGDGTFLKAAEKSMGRSIPIYGFNIGVFGLLTEFDRDKIDINVQRIINGEYIIEERNILDVYISDDMGNKRAKAHALNDCVISRNALSGIAYLNVYINGNLVDTYPCDGIIVATQTGSTAYSLSAGGPIIEPGNNVNVITPICSHFTDGRSIVTKSTSIISVSKRKPHKEINVSIDGHTHYLLSDNETVYCTESEKKINIIRIEPHNFYEALRKKTNARREKLMSGVDE